ncbi:MAG TPA: hypothetical protein VFI27_12450, partial [candidate division Zixibacteria bacterium]|nr:hypothetical protein [candidate division Zixibacteria bacterium]
SAVCSTTSNPASPSGWFKGMVGIVLAPHSEAEGPSWAALLPYSSTAAALSQSLMVEGFLNEQSRHGWHLLASRRS